MWGINALYMLPKSCNTLYFIFNCFAEDLFTLSINKFRKVCKVDGNLQLDSRHWSMYLDIVKGELQTKYKLLSYERALKMLENDACITTIDQAILEL